jgi:hypothetical protein
MHTGTAAATSTTECCRMNTVEMLMSTAADQKAIRHPEVFKLRAFHAVQATAAEPITWSEGQTLV